MPPWPSWTVEEAAEQTGYHPEYVRELCRTGKIESVKAGQMFMIRISSLMAYMESLDAADGRTGPKRPRS